MGKSDLTLVARRGLDYAKLWLANQLLGAIGGLFVLLTLIAATVGPALVGDPHYMTFSERLAPPSISHPLGTDAFGRDILARIVYGARVEVVISVASVLLGSLSGTFLALISGYYGGIGDEIVQRIVDGVMSFPLLILSLGIVSVLGASLPSIVVALSVPISARSVRVIRSSVIIVKETEFVLAAKATGCGNFSILTRHVAPQCLAPFLVVSTLWLSAAILAEAALSYLGFGLAPPFVSWGAMLSGDAALYFLQAPWTAIFPGLAITVLVYGVNLLGDSIRDVSDPRLRFQLSR